MASAVGSGRVPARTPARRRPHKKNDAVVPAAQGPAADINPLPPSLQDRCIATSCLIAEVLGNRFVCHLPYYRKAKMVARMGIAYAWRLRPRLLYLSV